MKTLKQFLEQFSGRVIGRTNHTSSEAMARRKENAGASDRAEKKREKIVASTNRGEVNELSNAGFDGKVAIKKEPVRTVDGKMTKTFPAKGSDGGDGGE